MTALPSISVPLLTQASRKNLQKKLNICPSDVLRLILHRLCDTNEDVARALHVELCVEQRPKPVSSIDIIDLTADAESDKENLVNQKCSATASTYSRKRKEPLDDNAAKKKVKRDAASEMRFEDRYVHCANCYELFDIQATPCHDHRDGSYGQRAAWSGNHDCCYHPGYLDVYDGDDFWADHNEEDDYGSIDSDESRVAYPEGYKWECCGQLGNTHGCTRGAHRQCPVLKWHAKLKRIGFEY